MKRKIFSTLFALVLLLTLGLVSAVPGASAASTYAGYKLGESTGNTAEWSTSANHSGNYGVKLTHTSDDNAWVEFAVDGGITVDDLASITTGWGLWYYLEAGKAQGPQLELRFTASNYDPLVNAAYVDISIDTLLTTYTAGSWQELTVDNTSTCLFYGNDPVDGTAFSYEETEGTPGGWNSVSKALNLVLAGINNTTEMTAHSASAATWELTRVKVEVWGGQARFVYADDVSIAGTTYDLEPFAPFDDYYMTGETLSVTVCRGSANADPMAIEEITIAAKSDTDTVGDTSVTLTETGSDTGVFAGSFTIIGAAPANRTNDEIVVSDEDDVTIVCTADWGAGSETLEPTTIVDDTAPVITIVSPAASSNITHVTPEIKATYMDAASGTDNTTAVMKLDGSVVAFTATTSQITYTPSANLTDGSYAVTVDISDIAGNAATQKSWSFTVDTVDPVITGQVADPTVIAPDPVETEVTFTATVTDATPSSGIDTVLINLSTVGGGSAVAMLDGGVAPDVTASDGIYTASANITKSEADYTLTITATDEAGNTDSEDITLVVSSDDTAPVIASPAIAYLYGLNSAPPGGHGGTVTISANVTDDVLMGTVTATCDAFTGTVNLLDNGSAPDATADDDVYTGTATVATGTSGNYTVTIAAVDDKGNEATPDTSSTLTVAAVTGYDIDLVEGWNLISLPLIPTDGSIDVVLADISDNVSQVRTWVYEAGVLTEKVWINDGPAGFTVMAAGRGYWIEMTEANELTVQGVVLPAAPQAPPSYSVNEGWNLIGFKSLSASLTAANYLGQAVMLTFERMYGYDAAGDVYTVIQPDTTNLEPGQGYWLAVSADGTIYP